MHRAAGRYARVREGVEEDFEARRLQGRLTGPQQRELPFPPDSDRQVLTCMLVCLATNDKH